MLILGLDIATICGWALYDTTSQNPSSTRAGAFVAEGDDEEKYGEFAGFLIPFLRQHKPDFVSIERPMRSVENASTGMVLNGMVGAAVALIWGGYKIPYGTIAPQTWHASYFPRGFRPPNIIIKKRDTGQLVDTGKADWKTAAVDQALRDRITLPATKKAGREDAAEAVGVAVCWKKCFIPPQSNRLNEQKFRALRGDRAVAA